MKVTPPNSILVINVCRIGDTLLATPALRALKAAWPAAELTVLGHPKRIEVIAHLPYVDRWLGFTKNSAIFRGYLGKRYDLAIVYGQDTALVRYALRVAPQVVAFDQADSQLNQRLNLSLENPAPHSIHAVERALLPIRAIGIPIPSRRLDFCVTAQEVVWAEKTLKQHGISRTSPKIGLKISSFPTKAYRDWPVSAFTALCEKVSAALPQAQFLVFGGAEETANVDTLVKRLGARAFNLCGHSLRESCALISTLDAYVGVDTGPTHIAGCFDFPIIGLYHCYLPQAIYGPLDHPANFCIDHPRLGCADCSERTPMAEIEVDTVLERLLAGLARRTSEAFSHV